FVRTCVGMKFDFYNQYLVMNNVFDNIFNVFRANSTKDNLINSAIIELLEFIKNEKIPALIDHITREHQSHLREIAPVYVFDLSSSKSGDDGSSADDNGFLT